MKTIGDRILEVLFNNPEPMPTQTIVAIAGVGNRGSAATAFVYLRKKGLIERVGRKVVDSGTRGGRSQVLWKLV